MVQSGAGRHIYYLSDPEAAALSLVKWNTFYQMANVIGALGTKISISLFILRIKNHRRFKLLLYGVMILLALPTVAIVISLCVSCIPLEKLWNPSISGYCTPTQIPLTISYVQSGFAIATDFFLTVSPIVILWNVKISKSRKWGICFLMSLGLIATISNALRNVYIPVLNTADITCKLPYSSLWVPVKQHTDNITPIVIVASLEFNLGVIAACIPTFVPLFTSPYIRHWLAKLSGRSTWNASAGTGSGDTIGQRNTVPESSVSSKHALTLSNTQYERRRSSQSDIPLRELDQSKSIVYTQSYSVEHGV